MNPYELPTVTIQHPDLPGGLIINADDYDPDTMQLMPAATDPADVEVLQNKIAYMEQTKATNGLSRSEQQTLTNLKKRLAKILPPETIPGEPTA